MNAVDESPMEAPTVFVIFGAAVWAGGRPSNAMRRRVDGALFSSSGMSRRLFVLTGGVGKHPPSEASAMFQLLQDAGVPADQIILDEAATDTFDSIRNCTRILKSLPATGKVFVCTDTYHILRCRWLFKLYGISTLAGSMASGRMQNGTRRWIYYYLRECAAILWDTLLALIRLGK